MLELRNAKGEKGTQTPRPRDVKCHYITLSADLHNIRPRFDCLTNQGRFMKLYY